MKTKRIVVTGMGVLTANGNNISEFWNSLVHGVSGVNYISLFDTSDFDVKFAAEVKKFDPSEYLKPISYRKLDRFAQLGLVATKMAVDDSALDLNKADTSRIGVIIGTGLGGISFHEEQIMQVMKFGPKKIATNSVPKISPNSVSSHIGITYGLKGINYAISTACSSGSNAIGQALLMIRAGVIDICICGGVEAPLTPVTVAAYQGLHVLSISNGVPPSKSYKPFDKYRNGFVIGEGAGILTLETYESALKRNAKIYAELIGYGSNCGAYHMVTPEPNGSDATAAMEMALDNGRIRYRDVDYINAHGTGTIQNDIIETKAIKNTFGKFAYDIPISSIKAMTGHTIGAAGAIEAIASILTINNHKIPPTINLNVTDSNCDLDYVPNEARCADVRVVCSNSFGFGSNNAVLVFRKV